MSSHPLTDRLEDAPHRQSESKPDPSTAPDVAGLSATTKAELVVSRKICAENKISEALCYSASTKRQPSSVARRFLFLSIYAIYLVVLLWAGLHFFLYLKYGILPTGSSSKADVWIYHYRELKETRVLSADISKEDGFYDVLLLGGSVLERSGTLIEEELKKQVQQPVRFYNLARSAHTSRDSYLKFSQLHDKPFDLIIIYHGINDVRMNCCPTPKFRDDYTHCVWYHSLNRRLASGDIMLSDLTLNDLVGFIPLGEPDENTLEYGRTIKTAQTFGQNLGEIIRWANHENQSVVLMDFAYYIPEDYSKSRFEKRELDYATGDMSLPAEVWGKPEYVAATIDAHNEQINQLAERYNELVFVPQHNLIPKEGQYFMDPCHLSPAGRKMFVENMITAIFEGKKQSASDNERGPKKHHE